MKGTTISHPVFTPSFGLSADILGMNQAAKSNNPYFLRGGDEEEKITKGSSRA